MLLYLSMIQKYLVKKGLSVTPINGENQSFETLRIGYNRFNDPKVLSLIPNSNEYLLLL